MNWDTIGSVAMFLLYLTLWHDYLYRSTPDLFDTAWVWMHVLFGVIALAVLCIDVRNKIKCRRHGHKESMYVGSIEDDPTPTHRKCLRCGHEEEIE